MFNLISWDRPSEYDSTTQVLRLNSLPMGLIYNIRSTQDGLLLRNKSCRGRWTTLTRSIQVLQSDECGLDSRELVGLRVSGRERNTDSRIVDCMSCVDVFIQGLCMHIR